MNGILLALLLLQAPVVLQNQHGSLTGRVRRLDDQPADRVRIAAMAVPETNASAAASGVLVSITESDGEGRFRLENIAPGRYYIIAGMVEFPTYFPGTMDPTSATVVEVTARNTVTGIDFVMRRPASVRVTGRLVGIADPKGLAVTMIGVLGLGASLQTAAQADGSFDFPRVPLGSYVVGAAGAARQSVIIEDKDVNIDLKPQYDGPGVKVSGRVIGIENFPAGSTPLVVLNGGIVNTLEIRIRPDGTFEFPRVPPGSYALRTMPMIAGIPVSRFDVGDMDMTGLTIQVPFQLQISGRLVTEGGDPPGRASISFSRSNGSMGTSIQNGTFRVDLIEGDHRVSVGQLPVGYVVKSITYDGVETSSIRIGPATTPKELVVKLGVVPVDSVPGARVSGRVINPVVVPRVSLMSETSGVTMADVPVSPDGTFLFPNVPQGLYFLRPMGPTVLPRTQVVRVESEDITNLMIEGQVVAATSGRVVTVDANGRQVATPIGVRLNFQRSNGASSGTVRPDGAFNVSLAEGDYTLAVTNVPTGYSVKSMISGSTDLGKSELQIRGSTSPPDIQITLEFAPQQR